jgi:hypothetical protein
MILLVYSVLIIVLFSVRREMAQKTGTKQPRSILAAGRLQVIQPGTVQKIFPGSKLFIHRL